MAAVPADKLALFPLRIQPLQRPSGCVRTAHEPGAGAEGLLHPLPLDEQWIGERPGSRRTSGAESQRHERPLHGQRRRRPECSFVRVGIQATLRQRPGAAWGYFRSTEQSCCWLATLGSSKLLIRKSDQYNHAEYSGWLSV